MSLERLQRANIDEFKKIWERWDEEKQQRGHERREPQMMPQSHAQSGGLFRLLDRTPPAFDPNRR